MSKTSRAEYNASRDGCTGQLLRYLNGRKPYWRDICIYRWTIIMEEMETIGLDMDVPIGKVLASIRAFDRITTKLGARHEHNHD